MFETPSQLINSAFEQARRSGKLDWHRMTTAVLKNRLLNLTGGEFQESSYGARTMREFVHLAGDIVSLDTTKDPPVVALIGEDVPEQEPDRPSTKSRVRQDLWRAVLDYSHGSTFVWDPESKTAREALPTDDLPKLPTISANEMRIWRKAFVDKTSLLALDDVSRKKLEAWQERILSSKAIPRPLAESWLVELKEKVVDLLSTWFAENEIEKPPDLLQPFEPLRPYLASAKPSLAALRETVIACIEVMSERELADLRFSPVTLLRAAQRQKRRAN